MRYIRRDDTEISSGRGQGRQRFLDSPGKPVPLARTDQSQNFLNVTLKIIISGYCVSPNLST